MKRNGTIPENGPRLNVGPHIAEGRRRLGLTQAQLAARLFVSPKTVSKWERGAGYPELPQVLALSDILGIPTDTLLRGERHGIAIAGNLLNDFVKFVEKYPTPGMLANVTSISRAVGGGVPNVGIDLARIDPSIRLRSFGRIGDDESGRFVMMELQKNGIDTSGVIISKKASTGFSDVMTQVGTGERTFFHHRGANAEFSPKDVPIASIGCRMLHIGYILLLDTFDGEDPAYGTVMARFLHDVQAQGIRTSIDVVSSNSGNFAEKVIPALRYTDNALMNEIEASGVSGIPPRDENGKLLPDNIRRTMEIIYAHGVRERVIVHCPEAGFCLGKDGFTVVPSLLLPPGYIKGAVGAGDAFAAGCLYGFYRGLSDYEMLEFASGAAACNLSAEDSVSGMKDKNAVYDLIAKTPKIKWEF